MKYYTRCIERFPLAPSTKEHGKLVFAMMSVGLYRAINAPCAEIFKRNPDKFPSEPAVARVRGRSIA